MTKTKQIVSYELLKEISDRTYQRRREAERECRRRERLRKEAQGVDKRKLRNIYKDIERDIKELEPDEIVDFGAGSYQDECACVRVERTWLDENKNTPLFLVDDEDPMTSVPRIVAHVYRTIIDDVLQYGYTPEFFQKREREMRDNKDREWLMVTDRFHLTVEMIGGKPCYDIREHSSTSDDLDGRKIGEIKQGYRGADVLFTKRIMFNSSELKEIVKLIDKARIHFRSWLNRKSNKND